jgi:predicted O-methyltransferase YrrM
LDNRNFEGRSSDPLSRTALIRNEGNSEPLLIAGEINLSQAEKVLKDIERMTRKQFLPIVGPQKGQILVETVRGVKPQRVLEVGTLIGYSAILIAKELEKKAQLITIEIHADEASIARENIRRAEVSPTVDVIVGDALKVIPKLTGKFDMMFIDADKTEYLAYLRLAENRLHKGSVVVADNAGIFADQMKDYLDYVRSSGKYSSKFMPVHEDGLEISFKL